MTPIMDPPLIALSAKFALIHDRNRVVLIQADRDPAVVGEHFGAPVIAAISFDERWCVTAGCGVVVYDLNDPFEGFESGRPSHQWWEIGRDLEQPWFVEQLYLVDEDRFRFVVDLDGPAAGLYEMHVPRGELRRILFPPDDDGSVPA